MVTFWLKEMLLQLMLLQLHSEAFLHGSVGWRGQRQPLHSLS